MTKLLNFTPHPIHIIGEDNQVIKTIESSGLIRLKANTVDAGFEVDGVKITTTEFGEPVGLPEEDRFIADPYSPHAEDHQHDGEVMTYYIVSQLVKSALPHRKDLLVPAEVVRDDKGNILGCKSLGI